MAKSKRTIGIEFIWVGLVLGGLTALFYVLFLGVSVGIGMGGGLKNPELVFGGFIFAASVSVLSFVVGVSMCRRHPAEDSPTGLGPDGESDRQRPASSLDQEKSTK